MFTYFLYILFTISLILSLISVILSLILSLRIMYLHTYYIEAQYIYLEIIQITCMDYYLSHPLPLTLFPVQKRDKGLARPHCSSYTHCCCPRYRPNSHFTHCSSCWNQGYQFYIKSPYIKHQTSVNTQIYFYSFAFRRILFFSWRLSPPLPLTDFACLRGLLPSSSYQSYLKLTAYALNLYGLPRVPSPDSIPSLEER